MWNLNPRHNVLEPALILTLERVCCDPLHPAPILRGAVRQAEPHKSHLLRTDDLFSIPDTFTLVFPFLIFCRNLYDWASCLSNPASLIHLITFLRGSWLWLLPLSSYSCPLNTEMSVVSPASLLTLSQALIWDLPHAMLLPATAGWSPCPNTPFSTPAWSGPLAKPTYSSYSHGGLCLVIVTLKRNPNSVEWYI